MVLKITARNNDITLRNCIMYTYTKAPGRHKKSFTDSKMLCSVPASPFSRGKLLAFFQFMLSKCSDETSFLSFFNRYGSSYLKQQGKYRQNTQSTLTRQQSCRHQTTVKHRQQSCRHHTTVKHRQQSCKHQTTVKQRQQSCRHQTTVKHRQQSCRHQTTVKHRQQSCRHQTTVKQRQQSCRHQTTVKHRQQSCRHQTTVKHRQQSSRHQ